MKVFFVPLLQFCHCFLSFSSKTVHVVALRHKQPPPATISKADCATFYKQFKESFTIDFSVGSGTAHATPQRNVQRRGDPLQEDVQLGDKILLI